MSANTSRFTPSRWKTPTVRQFREYLELMDLGGQPDVLDGLSALELRLAGLRDQPIPQRRTGSGSCAATRPHCTVYRRPVKALPGERPLSVSVSSEAVGSISRQAESF